MRARRWFPWLSAAVCLPALGQGIVEPSGRMAAMLYSGETTEIRTNLVLPTTGWARTITLPADNAVRTGGDPETVWKGSLDIDSSHKMQFTQTVRNTGTSTVIAVD